MSFLPWLVSLIHLTFLVTAHRLYVLAVLDLLRDQLHTVFGMLPAIIQGTVGCDLNFCKNLTDFLYFLAKVSLDRVNEFLSEVLPWCLSAFLVTTNIAISLNFWMNSPQRRLNPTPLFQFPNLVPKLTRTSLGSTTPSSPGTPIAMAQLPPDPANAISSFVSRMS